MQDPVVWDRFEEDEQESNELSPVLKATIVFLLLWQFTFWVPVTGMCVLLLFIHHFLQKIPMSLEAFRNFPKSLPDARRVIIGGSAVHFLEYVVCPKCNALYDFGDCVQPLLNTLFESKSCQHVMYPGHSQVSKRPPCGSILLQKVKIGNSVRLKPFKIYPHNSLKSDVEKLAMRPEFLEKCEHWRCRPTNPGTLSDIFDGKIWNEFQVVNGKPFLSERNSWAVTMNIDWFQPFTHVCDSVGAIYLVVQNLPRSERYR